MDYKSLTRVARGLEPADLVLKNGRVLNVFTGLFEDLDLAVHGGLIAGLGRYSGREEVDVQGRFVTPGMIDPHIHVESTMLAPAELARTVIARGTTALVCDPHEIANVLGLRGVEYMLDSSAGLPVDFYFMAPSSVPATHLETSGARLEADDLTPLLEHPRVLGLAEVMNFPGVINGDDGVWAKIEAFEGRVIDGHAPLLSGPDLCAYALPGIGTEHEASELEEAREKLARGMRVLIRQGSQARNLGNLLPLVTERHLPRLSFCTDDRHPQDLISEGHLDNILRLAVAGGLDPVKALTMATLNPAETYGLTRRGALAPGRLADIVVFRDLDRFETERVYKNGRLVSLNGELPAPGAAPEIPEWATSMKAVLPEMEALRRPVEGGRVRVIDLVDHELLTNHSLEPTPQKNGRLAVDLERDLCRLIVLERHQGTGNMGLGVVRGFGLQQGAAATSVAHDSHNIIAVGADDESLLAAVDEVIRMGGGQAVAGGGKVIARLPLPLAGLMTNGSVAEAAEQVLAANQAVSGLGCRIDEPFMTLSFLALPVIPHLRLTDLGLVDVDRFELTGLFE